MKAILIVLTIVLHAAIAHANVTVVAEFPAKQIAETGPLKSGVVVEEAGGPAALKVTSAGPAPLNATLLVIDQPKITTDFYAIVGEVRYDAVEGAGFLEMWNHFGDAAYFSRTLADFGPLAKLTGDSGWRAFRLPFNAAGAKGPVSKLVFNVQLPGKGTVHLRNVSLVQARSFAEAMGEEEPWWPVRATGWVFGLGGALLGCLGSLLEWLASRGKARGFVVNAVRVLIAMGVVSTVAGIAALTVRQLYAIWFPLLLLGVLCASLFPVRLRRYQQHFRDQELRRMSSMDLAPQGR